MKSINCNVMNISEIIHCDYDHWYVYDELIEYGEYSKEKLNEVQEENERLQLENQANIANNNIMLTTMNKINAKIEKKKKKLDSNESEIVIPDFNEKVSSNVTDILAEFDLDQTNL